MKKIKLYKIITLVLFSFLFFVSASPAFAAFGYSKRIIIDHTKVSGTVAAPTNFPVLINGVYSYLATTGNGGNVTNANGYDIGFYTSSDCSTGKMNWETVNYSATTGTVEYWVKVSALSSTVDTVFYMCYGDSGVTTDQSSATSVYDTNFRSVYHLKDGTTLSANDSTINVLNGTISGATAGPGKIDGAGAFNGSTGNINSAVGAWTAAIDNWTLEAWVNPSLLSTFNLAVFNGTDNGGYGFGVGNGAGAVGSKLEGLFGNVAWFDSGYTFPSTNVWYHIAMVRNSGITAFYVNGIQTPNTSGTTPSAVPAGFSLGMQYSGGYTPTRFFSGSLDQVSISDTPRSVDWILTEYNNQNSTSTFYTVANVVAPTGFSYYRTITIDKTKVGGTVATPVNFPILVNGVYSYLATVANGGKVTSNNGYDIGFYTNSNCSTGKMNWETVNYSATTGTVEYWVKTASLSTTTDTVLYMCYGNASIFTNQSSPASVWDTNFSAVWHLPDGATLSGADSKNAATWNNSGATAVAGKIDGAANFNGTTNYINISGLAQSTVGTTFTNSAWVYWVPTGASGSILASSGNGTQFRVEFSNQLGLLQQNVYGIAYSTGTITPNAWHHVGLSYDGTNYAFYIDGSPAGSGVNAYTQSFSGNYQIGTKTNGGEYFGGNIDDLRVSNSIRSADWIKTEYNATATSTFYTIGNETNAISTASRIGKVINRFVKMIIKRGRMIIR